MKFKFQAFHPYLTYKNEGRYFIAPNGEPSFSGWPSVSHPTDMDQDARHLWQLGRQAFEAFGEFTSKEEFDASYGYYLETIRALRIELGKRILGNNLVFVNSHEEEHTPDIDDLPNSAIVNIIWQAARTQSGDCSDLGGLFLFACLEEIDSAIIAMCLDGSAASLALRAAEAFANFQAIESGNDNLQKARSELAVRNATERYKRDPKQAAKAFVKECWNQWQENPTLYNTQSTFASDMLTKVQTNAEGNPIISFDTILKKWIPLWTKEKK